MPQRVHHAAKEVALSDPDELFLTLSRMHLNLLQEDLHYRFEVSVTTISESFITWTSRLRCCLSSFDQIPGLEEGLRHLRPECFKGEFEDSDPVIDCTEVLAFRFYCTVSNLVGVQGA